MTNAPADPSNPLEYFGHLAKTYDQHRPTYADSAIQFVLHDLDRPLIAADIGAGTGISARHLSSHGVDVIGIEPNDDMRALAKRQGSVGDGTIRYAHGTAERTGLDHGSVDLVVCAQSFHWFDPARTIPEFRRIIGPGGRLVLMWNLTSTTAGGMTAVYREMVLEAQDDAAARGLEVHRLRSANRDVLLGQFVDIEQERFPNPARYDLADLLGRARSASYFPPEGHRLRQELETRLCDAHRRFADEAGIVTLDQKTDVLRATRP